MITRFLLFIGMLFCAGVCSAQESARLQLMNGKEIEVFQFDDSTQTILTYKYDKNYYKRERINLKAARKAGVFYTPSFTTEKAKSLPVVLRDGQMEREEAFAVHFPDSTEKVFYTFDEPNGNYLTENQMRAFVIGEKDARFGVRGRFWLISGFAVGAIAGYALETSVYTLAVPPLFALSAQIPVVKIKEKHISDKAYLYNEDYAAGYEAYSRSKNTRQALKGSVLGMLVGMLTYAIVDNN